MISIHKILSIALLKNMRESFIKLQWSGSCNLHCLWCKRRYVGLRVF